MTHENIDDKASPFTLIIYRIGPIEALNSFIEYASENIQNSTTYYLTDNCLRDQFKIVSFFETMNITAVLNFSGMDLCLDVNFLQEIKSRFKFKLIALHADIPEYFDTFFVYVAQFHDLVLVDDWSELQNYRNYGFVAEFFTHGYALKYKMDPNTIRDIDVSFVGRMDRHGRNELMSLLSESDLNIAVYGYGSSNGFISSEKMMEVYGRSKIVLNLTTISTVVPHFEINKSINNLVNQAKGRIYEGAITGAMVISENSQSLPFYGKDGKDYVVFNSHGELLKIIDFYLNNENDRLRIARAGFDNALKYGSHLSQTEQIKILIDRTSISNTENIYIDSIYHKYISRSILDGFIRSLIKLKKPDFSILDGKKISFLIFAVARAFFYYPYNLTIKKLKSNE